MDRVPAARSACGPLRCGQASSSAPPVSARRVFPVPPVPVRVRRRTAGRRIRSRMAARSRTRPTSDVAGAGRWCQGRVAATSAGPTWTAKLAPDPSCANLLVLARRCAPVRGTWLCDQDAVYRFLGGQRECSSARDGRPVWNSTSSRKLHPLVRIRRSAPDASSGQSSWGIDVEYS
jgi:hypothetical protein